MTKYILTWPSLSMAVNRTLFLLTCSTLISLHIYVNLQIMFNEIQSNTRYKFRILTLVLSTSRKFPNNLITNLEFRPSDVSLSLTRNVPRPLSAQLLEALSNAKSLQLICNLEMYFVKLCTQNDSDTANVIFLLVTHSVRLLHQLR